MNRQKKFANSKYKGNLKTVTAVVSKYIENLLQTSVKNFIYYRIPFCLRLRDHVYFIIQTPRWNLNLMSRFRMRVALIIKATEFFHLVTFIIKSDFLIINANCMVASWILFLAFI